MWTFWKTVKNVTNRNSKIFGFHISGRLFCWLLEVLICIHHILLHHLVIYAMVVRSWRAGGRIVSRGRFSPSRSWYSPSPGLYGLGGGEHCPREVWALSARGVSFVRESACWLLGLLHCCISWLTAEICDMWLRILITSLLSNFWLPGSDDPPTPFGYPFRVNHQLYFFVKPNFAQFCFNLLLTNLGKPFENSLG